MRPDDEADGEHLEGLATHVHVLGVVRRPRWPRRLPARQQRPQRAVGGGPRDLLDGAHHRQVREAAGRLCTRHGCGQQPHRRGTTRHGRLWSAATLAGHHTTWPAVVSSDRMGTTRYSRLWSAATPAGHHMTRPAVVSSHTGGAPHDTAGCGQQPHWQGTT